MTANQVANRQAMYNDNVLKLGFFGSNCSSGRFITKVPERWSGSWEDNLRLALMMDEAGMDFILPIGRWKGYGGETDYEGATFETITWAAGLLARTKRMTVFGTVHAPLFPPLIASKMIVTADHIGAGRFGLNIVCGHNEGEFEMFGATGSDHATRYRQGQEWIDVLRATWSREDFDVDGEFFTLRGVREKPKPYGDSFPLTMNAGTSGDGRAFALRNCDAWFTTLNTPTLNPADIHAVAERVNEAKAEAGASGREIEAYTVGIVICRPTRKEAQEYHHYVAFEYADWEAIDAILKMRGLDTGTPEQIQQRRQAQANGMGGVPFIGSPDEIAAYLAGLSQAGFRGCGISMVNYADEFPYFRDEVLPRLERLKLRSAVRSF